MIPVKPRKGISMDPEKDEIEDVIDRGDFIDDDDEHLDDDDVSPDEDESEEESDTDEDESEEDEDNDDDEDGDSSDTDEDEDEDSEEEDEEDDEEVDGEGNQRIPRSRLNQVIQQREDAKERSAWLEEQLEVLIKQRQAPEEPTVPEVVIPDYDFDASEEKYGDLILEGSVKEAAALRREINAEQNKLFEAQIATVREEASVEAAKTSKASVEDGAFSTFLDDVVSEKSYLDDQSDDYNERAVKMANSLMSSYLAEGGYTKAEALALAVSDIGPLFEDDKPEQLGKKKASTRDKSARKKAVKASEQQPPNAERRTGRKGVDLDNIDVGKMSDKQFNSLTRKERATLRGD